MQVFMRDKVEEMVVRVRLCFRARKWWVATIGIAFVIAGVACAIYGKQSALSAGTQRTQLNLMSTHNGIAMQVKSAGRVGEQLDVELCYDMPADHNSVDYLPKDITMQAGGTLLKLESGRLYEWIFDSADDKLPADEVALPEGVAKWRAYEGKPTQRCDLYSFTSSVVSQSNNFNLTIGGYGLSGLPESLKCDQIRKQLAEHQLDFEVECVNQPGMVGFHVTRFPAGMSEQEAQQMAYQVITDYRSGPWEFTIDLGK
jgi:hypothetical protein